MRSQAWQLSWWCWHRQKAWRMAPNLTVAYLLLISCSKELCVPQAQPYQKRTSLPFSLTAVMQLFVEWIEHGDGEWEVEEKDLEQVTAPISCIEMILNYNKQLEWRREIMGIKMYKMEDRLKNEKRGGSKRKRPGLSHESFVRQQGLHALVINCRLKDLT